MNKKTFLQFLHCSQLLLYGNGDELWFNTNVTLLILEKMLLLSGLKGPNLFITCQEF